MFKAALRLFKGLREMAKEPAPIVFDLSGFATLSTRDISLPHCGDDRRHEGSDGNNSSPTL